MLVINGFAAWLLNANAEMPPAMMATSETFN
jgi:hypothetical protein